MKASDEYHYSLYALRRALRDEYNLIVPYTAIWGLAATNAIPVKQVGKLWKTLKTDTPKIAEIVRSRYARSA